MILRRFAPAVFALPLLAPPLLAHEPGATAQLLAALLAVRILSLADEELKGKLKHYTQKLAEQSAEADAALQKEIESL